MVLTDDLESVAADQDTPDVADVYDTDESVPLEDVFDDEFVSEHTSFETFDELVADSPADADTAADLGTIADGDWDEFVAETTDFAGEDAFVMAGRDHWVAKRLELA